MTKKTISIYIISAIFIFSGFVIARAPADFVLAHVAKSTKRITPYQVTGTVWNGSAADMAVHHAGSVIPLGPTEWEVSFLPLLLGKLDVKLKAIKSDQKIIGEFKLGSGPYLKACNVEIVFDAAMIKQFDAVPGEIQGNVELSLVKLVFDGNTIEELDGTAVIKDSVYTLGSPVELGSYAAKLSVKDNIVKADLSDIDASVVVSGVASVSPETKKYNANVNLNPKPDANPMIQQTLQAFTKKKPDGSFQFVL